MRGNHNKIAQNEQKRGTHSGGKSDQKWCVDVVQHQTQMAIVAAELHPLWENLESRQPYINAYPVIYGLLFFSSQLMCTSITFSSDQTQASYTGTKGLTKNYYFLEARL